MPNGVERSGTNSGPWVGVIRKWGATGWRVNSGERRQVASALLAQRITARLVRRTSKSCNLMPFANCAAGNLDLCM